MLYPKPSPVQANKIVQAAWQQHDVLQERTHQQNFIKPTCCKGCHACCYEPVLIEKQEALAIVAHVIGTWSQDAIDELRMKVRRYVDSFVRNGFQQATDYPDLIGFLRARLACPFLDTNGLCSIYEYRPLACRDHVAVGPREKCDDITLRLQQKFVNCVEAMLAPMSTLAILDNGMLEIEYLPLFLDELLNRSTLNYRSGMRERKAFNVVAAEEVLKRKGIDHATTGK